MKKRIWKIILAAAAIMTALSLSSCRGNLDGLEFSSSLSEEERVYYTGQRLDTEVSTKRGQVSKIPQIYVVYKDGTRSDDVSHTDAVTFSGYDPDTPGEQTVTVTYTEGSHEVKASYKITVRQRVLCYIEADDTYRYLHPFTVGDNFTVSEEIGGVKRGVTVTLRYNDPDHPSEAFFADDPALDGIAFDTAGCRLDADGKFTEAGTFPVQVSYLGMSATYRILVVEQEKED